MSIYCFRIGKSTTFPGRCCSPDEETALNLNDAHCASARRKASFTSGESTMEFSRVCEEILQSLRVSRYVDYVKILAFRAYRQHTREYRNIQPALDVDAQAAESGIRSIP